MFCSSAISNKKAKSYTQIFSFRMDLPFQRSYIRTAQHICSPFLHLSVPLQVGKYLEDSLGSQLGSHPSCTCTVCSMPTYTILNRHSHNLLNRPCKCTQKACIWLNLPISRRCLFLGKLGPPRQYRWLNTCKRFAQPACTPV